VTSGATVTLSGLTISNGELVSDYNDVYGAGIENAGTLTLNHATVSGNNTNDYRGGIDNTGALTLNESIVGGNSAFLGGGISNTGTLTLTNSTVNGNAAGTTWGWGGGIDNRGTATIIDSTISGNYADDAGGGIANGGTLTLTNSTVSGNSAIEGGGGILNPGTATVTNCTITGNSTTVYEPGGGISNGSTLDLYDTIVSGNVRYDDTGGTTPDDVAGTLNSLGHNLIGNTSGGSGFASTDLLNVDPMLGPLQDNGGPTYTQALLPGSPAINAGDNTAAPPFDQRGEGYPRVVGGTIDIGAFEVQASSAVVADAGFEAPSAGPAGSYGSYLYRPAGAPWTFSGGAGVAANGSGFTAGNPSAPEGGQVAFLHGTGSVSQAVSGWAAGTYVVTFEAAQRGNWQASQQDFQVLVDGAVVGTFTPAGTTYQAYATAAFTVSAGAHTIAFQALDTAGGDNTAFVDAVQIVAS
jgi:hypothetical protein